jgi:hypothetical protein
VHCRRATAGSLRPPTTNSARKTTHSYQSQGYGCLNSTAIREQADMAYLSGSRLPHAQPHSPSRELTPSGQARAPAANRPRAHHSQDLRLHSARSPERKPSSLLHDDPAGVRALKCISRTGLTQGPATAGQARQTVVQRPATTKTRAPLPKSHNSRVTPPKATARWSSPASSSR